MISIYGKHLWKLTKSKPVQPLTIIISIALAVVVFVTALFYQSVMLQKIETERTALFRNSDIRVSISSESRQNYFEYNDIKSCLDENDLVECYFSYYANFVSESGDKPAPVLGVDFARINRINTIEFINSGKISARIQLKYYS
mgnify:CR=1 FL=1